MRHTLANTLQRGLSLIELMVTLSIAVILLTIGVPSFVDMMSSNTAGNYANDLLADFNYARSEAITRGMRVVVCKGPTAANCTTGQWEGGWKVFVDCNSNGSRNTTAVCPDWDGDGTADPEPVLRIHGALAANWTLRGNGTLNNRLIYLPDGRVANNGTYALCKDNTMEATAGRALVINRTGRVRMATDTNTPADGMPNNDAGANIGCSP